FSPSSKREPRMLKVMMRRLVMVSPSTDHVRERCGVPAPTAGQDDVVLPEALFPAAKARSAVRKAAVLQFRTAAAQRTPTAAAACSTCCSSGVSSAQLRFHTP